MDAFANFLNEPPQHVIEAARILKLWAEERGYKDWSVMGIGPYKRWCNHIRCMICNPGV